MQHNQADQTHAPERYLLGEMSPVELEEFEEHFFECTECAEAVKTGAILTDNARAVFQAEPAPAPVRTKPVETSGRARLPWWTRFRLPVLAPTFAALALLGVVTYQRLVVIPGLESQVAEITTLQPLFAFPLHAVSRGEPRLIELPPAARFFSLYFEVATESPSGYLCEIRDASGKIRLSTRVPQPKPGDMVNLFLERSKLRGGDYTLVVRADGPETKEVGQYPFRLEYK